LGRRELLRRLVEAKVPNELWDEFRMICRREGVQKLDEGISPTFCGFGRSSRVSDEEMTRLVREIWVNGMRCVLRAMGKESLIEQRMEIQRLCEKHGVELHEKVGIHPL
jgi:hypothetical protein